MSSSSGARTGGLPYALTVDRLAPRSDPDLDPKVGGWDHRLGRHLGPSLSQLRLVMSSAALSVSRRQPFDLFGEGLPNKLGQEH
jgi:hypothetical protein